jgi:hypothetical protein
MTRRSGTPITERGCDVACCFYYYHSHPGPTLETTRIDFLLLSPATCAHNRATSVFKSSRGPSNYRLKKQESQTTTSKAKSRTMSGAAIASPSIIVRISIKTAHHDRGAGSLEAYRGHGLLAEVCFDTTDRSPFPNLSLRCSIKNRDVVFVLLSAFSRGRLELARENLLLSRIRASGEKDHLPSPPATLPDFRQTLRRRQTDTFGAI